MSKKVARDRFWDHQCPRCDSVTRFDSYEAQREARANYTQELCARCKLISANTPDLAKWIEDVVRVAVENAIETHERHCTHGCDTDHA